MDNKLDGDSRLLLKRIPAVIAVILLATLPTYGQTIITDPVDDASGHHDALAISGGFAHGNLYLSATFESGSLDPSHFAFMFGLDTDQNPNTGIQYLPASFPLGAEWICFYNSLADSDHVSFSFFDTNAAATVFSRPVQIDANSLRVTIPLPLIDPDGMMNFGFVCGVPADANGFIPYDVVPDSAWGGWLEGPTSLIPELKIARLGPVIELRWSGQASDYVLEATSGLAASNLWELVTNEVVIVGDEKVVVDSFSAQKRFYRLRK